MATQHTHGIVVSRKIKGLAKECETFASAHNSNDTNVRIALDLRSETRIRVVVLIEHGSDQVLADITYNTTRVFDAPVVRFLTPNNVFVMGESVCLNGLTHYHPESFCPVNIRICSIVDAMSMAVLHDSARLDLVGAIGVRTDSVPGIGKDTRTYNSEHHAEILSLFRI